jgi:hypothetical protein
VEPAEQEREPKGIATKTRPEGRGGGEVEGAEGVRPQLATLAAASLLSREASVFQPWELTFTMFTVSNSLLYFLELDSISIAFS